MRPAISAPFQLAQLRLYSTEGIVTLEVDNSTSPDVLNMKEGNKNSGSRQKNIPKKETATENKYPIRQIRSRKH
jgi:hypothetical protein